MSRIILKDPGAGGIYKADQWSEKDPNRYSAVYKTGDYYGLAEEEKGAKATTNALARFGKITDSINKASESPAGGALLNLGKAALTKLGQMNVEDDQYSQLEDERQRLYGEAEKLDAAANQEGLAMQQRVLGDSNAANIEMRQQFVVGFPQLAQTDPAKASLALDAAVAKGIIKSEEAFAIRERMKKANPNAQLADSYRDVSGQITNQRAENEAVRALSGDSRMQANSDEQFRGLVGQANLNQTRDQELRNQQQQLEESAMAASATKPNYANLIPQETVDQTKMKVLQNLESKGYKDTKHFIAAAQGVLNGRKPEALPPSERLVYDAIAEKVKSGWSGTNEQLKDANVMGAPRQTLEDRKKAADAALQQRLASGDTNLPKGATYDPKTGQFTLAETEIPTFETLLAEAETAKTPEDRKAVMDKFRDIDVPTENIADMLSGKSRRELGLKLADAMRKGTPRKTAAEIEAEIELLKARAKDIPEKTKETIRNNTANQELKSAANNLKDKFETGKLTLNRLKEWSKETGIQLPTSILRDLNPSPEAWEELAYRAANPDEQNKTQKADADKMKAMFNQKKLNIDTLQEYAKENGKVIPTDIIQKARMGKELSDEDFVRITKSIGSQQARTDASRLALASASLKERAASGRTDDLGFVTNSKGQPINPANGQVIPGKFVGGQFVPNNIMDATQVPVPTVKAKEKEKEEKMGPAERKAETYLADNPGSAEIVKQINEKLDEASKIEKEFKAKPTYQQKPGKPAYKEYSDNKKRITEDVDKLKSQRLKAAASEATLKKPVTELPQPKNEGK